jgi:hypothetical protein
MRDGEESARQYFFELMRPRVQAVLERIAAKVELPCPCDKSTERLLHVAAIWIRFRMNWDVGRLSWGAFQRALLLKMARSLLHPHSKSDDLFPVVPQSLECKHYVSQMCFRPLDKVGPNQFGGDWIGFKRLKDDSLFVVLADVSGHGYAAYLLAVGLPALWEYCCRSFVLEDASLTEISSWFHTTLESCLPEDVFVEAFLARISPSGSINIAPAGGVRLVTRSGRSVTVHSLRGTLWGVTPPNSGDEWSYSLNANDEVLLSSDGFFDQLHGAGDAMGDGEQIPTSVDEEEGLWPLAIKLLNRALERFGQKDDISLVSLRRTETMEGKLHD